MKKQILSFIAFTFLAFCFYACDYVPNRSNIIAAKQNIIDTGLRYIIIQKDTAAITKDTVDSVKTIKFDSLVVEVKPDTIPAPAKPVVMPTATINSKAIEIINYAKTMIGKPYVYGVNTPEKGFDNSGFVNHVFSHFNIKVPKYAASFIATGNNVPINELGEGDIILFSKTDSVKKAVYQIGIVVSPKGAPISFIHASSGKINGVGLTNMSSYYQRKLMGFRRVF
ncbi:C40 family peptidase [Pedobacter alpinus]|uniref:C40 family peptidase n=1 Tax=Pedobacter alpinus TaxID=1590643 RepID=A0ABW5TW62_9SPHI